MLINAASSLNLSSGILLGINVLYACIICIFYYQHFKEFLFLRKNLQLERKLNAQ